jgi:hypothetical protein
MCQLGPKAFPAVGDSVVARGAADPSTYAKSMPHGMACPPARFGNRTGAGVLARRSRLSKESRKEAGARAAETTGLKFAAPISRAAPSSRPGATIDVLHKDDRTECNDINDLNLIVDQEIGGSNPPGCTNGAWGPPG